MSQMQHKPYGGRVSPRLAATGISRASTESDGPLNLARNENAGLETERLL